MSRFFENDFKLVLCSGSQGLALDADIVFDSLDVRYARNGNFDKPSHIQVSESLASSIHFE